MAGKIPQYKCEWLQRIFNYCLIAKDLRDVNTEAFSKSLLLSEMITSDQSSDSICNIFSILKNKFNKHFKLNLKFRIILIDYSWASIHAILETLNLEDVSAYSKRVYRLAQMRTHEINDCVKNYTWLISCCSHTMHRFVKALSVKFWESETIFMI